VLLTVRDETPAARMLAEMDLELPETVTLRELIGIRVREEWPGTTPAVGPASGV
jgi:hypothetical protein